MQSLIGFIGGGNMARSLIGGLLRTGHDRDRVRVYEPQAGLAETLREDFAIALAADNASVAAECDVLVLAVKPQVMRSVCAEIAPALAGRAPLVLSIAAGIRTAQLAGWLGDHAIVRAMPNTPALIGAGISGLHANERTSAPQRALAAAVLAAAGDTVWIDDESLLDAVTAVSGSGPAYFFLLIEALEQAAIAQGLPAETARALVLQTALGAARMARESHESPATLRERVTSPGGTTAAALEVLHARDLRGIVAEAIARATARGRELSDAFGK